VVTDSGIEGKIDIKDIKDIVGEENILSHEELKNVAKIGMYLNVRVKSIKSEDNKKVSVFFSSKASDLNLSRRNNIIHHK